MRDERPGFVAPVLAVLLAVVLGGAAFDRFAAHVTGEVTAWRAEVLALALVEGRAPVARLAASDGPAARASLVAQDGTGGKYAFLRRYRYTDASEAERVGRRLDPADAADKAVADAYVAALTAPAVVPLADGGARAAVRREGATAVVDARPVSVPTAPFWMVRAVVGALALAAWWLLLRRTKPGRWQAVLGAGFAASLLLTALLYSLGAVAFAAEGAVAATRAALDGQPLSAPALARGGGVALAALTVLPLVLVGVAGWISRSRRSPHRAAYTYVGPALVGLGVLVLAPFLFGLALAFTRASQGHVEWVGLQNFARILSSEGYGITHPLSFYFTLVVTVLWTAINIALHAGIGLGLALLLNRPTLPFKGVYRMLLIVPWAVPSYITALVWKGMFNKQYGLVNNVLGLAGIEPIGWFSQFWTSFTANVVTNTWLGFPFMMVVCLGALQSIPKELYEAAEVDGASRWHRFRHITLPLLQPALLPAIILGSIWTFNMFNIVYLVSGGQPGNSTDILITEAYRWAFEQGQYGYAAAYSVLIFLILLSYSLLTQRVAKKAEGAYA